MSNKNTHVVIVDPNNPDNKEKAEKYSQTTMVLLIIYIVVAIITFWVWIYCGVKSQSFAQVLVGLFFSIFWPVLWTYVAYKKWLSKDMNWRFCKIVKNV